MIQFTKNVKTYQREKTFITVNTWNSRRISTGSGSWEFPPHMLEHYTLIYPISSDIVINIGTKSFVLKEFDLLCAMPGIQISASPTGRTFCTFYLVEFDCSELPFFEMPNGYLSVQVSRGAEEYFYHLNDTMRSVSSQKCICDAQLLLILSDIERSMTGEPSHRQLYSDMRRYISLHIEEDLTVESISLAMSYNKDHLGRIARKCGNTTIKQLIIDEKISASKSLLISTNYSVTKIATILHFSSLNNFLKYFNITRTPRRRPIGGFICEIIIRRL